MVMCMGVSMHEKCVKTEKQAKNEEVEEGR